MSTGVTVGVLLGPAHATPHPGRRDVRAPTRAVGAVLLSSGRVVVCNTGDETKVHYLKNGQSIALCRVVGRLGAQHSLALSDRCFDHLVVIVLSWLSSSCSRCCNLTLLIMELIFVVLDIRLTCGEPQEWWQRFLERFETAAISQRKPVGKLDES